MGGRGWGGQRTFNCHYIRCSPSKVQLIVLRGVVDSEEQHLVHRGPFQGNPARGPDRRVFSSQAVSEGVPVVSYQFTTNNNGLAGCQCLARPLSRRRGSFVKQREPGRGQRLFKHRGPLSLPGSPGSSHPARVPLAGPRPSSQR